jgi:hypothetical protein
MKLVFATISKYVGVSLEGVVDILSFRVAKMLRYFRYRGPYAGFVVVLLQQQTGRQCYQLCVLRTEQNSAVELP